MKKYDPKIAAVMAVRKNVMHGLSRHQWPELARTKVTSIATEVAHVSALTQFSRFLLETRKRHLKNSTADEAYAFLNAIAGTKKQATVSLARQAMNMHLRYQAPLNFVKSHVQTIPINRAYTKTQIDLLIQHAKPELQLSISLVVSSGLRGMELVSIAEMLDLQLSARPWRADLFTGRENYCRFAVHGKGGLIREVRMAPELASRTRALNRPSPVTIKHREGHLISHFDLVSGQQFSAQFGRLSKKILGFSLGAHGLRHSYAQTRRDELLCRGLAMKTCLDILSQELGHFCDKNTQAYLRD